MAPPAKPTVLLVEDNPADAQLARLAMSEAGLEADVLNARSGREALQLVRHYCETHVCPDLILLDLNLPDCSGHEVCAALKQDPQLAQIPVIVLSSSTYPPDLQRAASLGALDYWVKPASFDDFVCQMTEVRRHIAHT